MKRLALGMTLAAMTIGALMSGCGATDEARIREIARDEAQKMVNLQTANPEKFGFGVAWEEEFSYSQGTRVGNLVFVAGQLAHGRTVDADGMPEFFMGDIEQQLRATFDNMKAVLANYGATMDDVVFLQNFVAPVSGNGKNKAGDYFPIASRIIREYFPNGIQAMTFVDVVSLYGPDQLFESNAIAVIRQ